jgi:hypothetical protein
MKDLTIVLAVGLLGPALPPIALDMASNRLEAVQLPHR